MKCQLSISIVFIHYIQVMHDKTSCAKEMTQLRDVWKHLWTDPQVLTVSADAN